MSPIYSSMQVLEVKNIGEALETRNKESAKRCLRLTLTDGQQTVVGWEYRPPLRGLGFCPPDHPPIGLKVGHASLSESSCIRRIEESTFWYSHRDYIEIWLNSTS